MRTSNEDREAGSVKAALRAPRAGDKPTQTGTTGCPWEIAASKRWGEAVNAMDHQYTRHHVPRGTRPDAVSGQDRYLIKNVTRLRLTYQLRLATFMASQTGTRLHVRVPQG